MRSMKAIVYIMILTLSLVAVGCGNGGDSIEHKRDYSFFQPMMNDSADFKQAEQKMSELKVLTSNDKYNMRYALFDNGKFFYEVGNLGTGTGDWSFKNGYLNLFAIRTFFDIDINLIAADEAGSAMAMQFMDRFGRNTVSAQLRDPGVAQNLKPLKKLVMPDKGVL